MTSGQWLVAKNGRMIASYEHVKALSGLGSLEEINRAGRDGLSALRIVSKGGEVRLTSQIRRAAASVAANIAEGAEREGTREFLQFLGIASGLLAETETFLILAERLGLVLGQDVNPLLGACPTLRS